MTKDNKNPIISGIGFVGKGKSNYSNLLKLAIKADKNLVGNIKVDEPKISVSNYKEYVDCEKQK